MGHSVFHKFLAVVLVAIILCATTTGICHEAHADAEVLCRYSSHHDGATAVAAADSQCPSCPDADHAGADHCEATCYCSCHLPVIATGIKFTYSPVVIDHLSQDIFSPPQDIFLSLFVPPDSLV